MLQTVQLINQWRVKYWPLRNISPVKLLSRLHCTSEREVVHMSLFTFCFKASKHIVCINPSRYLNLFYFLLSLIWYYIITKRFSKIGITKILWNIPFENELNTVWLTKLHREGILIHSQQRHNKAKRTQKYTY